MLGPDQYRKIADGESAAISEVKLSKVNQGFAVSLVRCPGRSDRYFVLDVYIGSPVPIEYAFFFAKLTNFLSLSFDMMVAYSFRTPEQEFDKQIEMVLKDGFREIDLAGYNSFLEKWREHGGQNTE